MHHKQQLAASPPGPAEKEPAEGSREIIEHELERQHSDGQAGRERKSSATPTQHGVHGTKLDGKTIAVLIAPRGTEDSEFAKPKQAIEAAAGKVVVVSFESGEARTVNHDLDEASSYGVDKGFADVSVGDFDGIVIPGGTVGADKLRGNSEAVAFVRKFFEAQKPVAAICHGPWTLVEADVLKGRKLTSYPTLKTDIENAGGQWVDEEVVVDRGLVTSRGPSDLPAFCAKLVEEFAEGKHPAMASSGG